VEQLCSRIAVLKQGRKVFEGPLSGINGTPKWVRLRVSDFAGAVKLLRQDQLIMDEREGKWIALAAGSGTDQVVRCLVKHGISVYEIAPEEQTLEDFYLSLMRSGRELKDRPLDSPAAPVTAGRL